MEEIQLIISMGGALFSLTVTTLTFVRMIKNGKAKKAMEKAIKISNAILPFIREAEQFNSYKGEEKKAYVMTRANQFAIENRIPFKEEQISDKIEELVALTKHVNAKPEVAQEPVEQSITSLL